MDITHESLHGQDILILGPYRPWNYHKSNGGDVGNYPSHSGKILDIKQGKVSGIEYFHTYLSPRLENYPIVISVPSHDPTKLSSGIVQLAVKLQAESGSVNASSCLVRHSKIVKLADGGDRSIDVHLASIRVEKSEIFENRPVLLMDDVMTTGNSLLACRRLLLEAGAANVKCLALGRTTY